MIDARDNLTLLIHQWRNAPRLRALAEGMVGIIQDHLIAPLYALEDTQNLETASGAALNDIGERLGIDRGQVIPTDIEFFGFDMGGSGFDQDPFFSTLLGSVLVVDEMDTPYRRALRARGRTLRIGSSIDDFKYALDAAEVNYWTVTDNGNGTFSVRVHRTLDKTRIQDLIEREALPVPLGIGISIDTAISPSQDVIYWGNANSVSTPRDWANFSANATTFPYAHDEQALVIPTFTGADYLVFAQRESDPDIVSATVQEFEQIEAFEKRSLAWVEQGIGYDAWVTTYEILGAAVGGDLVKFTR